MQTRKHMLLLFHQLMVVTVLGVSGVPALSLVMVALFPDPVHAPTLRHSLAVRTALAWDPVPKVMTVIGSVVLWVRTETF